MNMENTFKEQICLFERDKRLTYIFLRPEAMNFRYMLLGGKTLPTGDKKLNYVAFYFGL